MGEIIMDIAEKYIQDVLFRIQAPPGERKRIEFDLRNHLQDLRAELGEDFSPAAIIDRVGTAQEVAEEFMSNIELIYAGFWMRLLAFFIDILACFSVCGLLSLPAIFIANFSSIDLSVPGIIFALAAVSLVIAAAGLMMLYFPILEGRYGTTLGKHLLRLHVVKECGAPIGYKEAFLRRIPYYFEFMAIDMLFIPFTAKKQRAFDMIAETVVIKNG